jgi:hypothetical protein
LRLSELSISSISTMDEHRQLLTELEVMVEKHGDEMGEGQDIMSEDAASTISIEWDDWSSATYPQSMKDEVLADALRKANTDLLWKFEIPWMKQVSRARIKERKKIEIEKWKIDSKRIRKGSRLRAREMRRWEWDARRKVEKARILGEDLWAWDLESRRMEEESRRMDEESIMMEREWMIAEGLLEEEQELMGEPQDEELVFGEKWMEKKEELRRMELESRRMELEWERKEELRTLEAFTGRDQDRWSRLMTVDLPTTEMEESIPINENWMTISQESMNEDLKVPEGSNENKESIMNEDFRKIVDEIMKEELIVKAKDKWHDEGSMGVFSDEVMGYEEAMDYPPSIVNELRGWRPATPTVCGRDACDEEAMDYELSIMDEISGLYPTSPFSKKQKTFHYDPLDQPKQEIRIVRLHPRRWLTDPDISCDLITLDLRTAPEYEALSYEWGCPPSASNQYTIQINSRLMVITRNLWLALYELRDRRKPRTLWIDALCINQLDVLERSCQVSRMGDIYSQAITVVAWIVGVGKNPFPLLDCFMIFCLRQSTLPKYIKQFLTSPSPRDSKITRANMAVLSWQS